MSLILKGFLSFILLFLISDILVKYFSFGITPDAIYITLFGNEEEFIDPITKSYFLEFWHTEIFFIMMNLLTLSAIFIRLSNKSKIAMTNILMISAIISLISLPMSFFISSDFVYIYLLTFFIWHLSAIYMILYSFWKLNDKSI
ncbi:hypothetical protein [Sulfurimonas sp.]|uniref:hypothetical protein n=1 Tax=Sulfurimonas sp. TaxID=2022749 RepID=UPI002B485903|nr:hypothetical protein [Sulfurimonas sp.]